MAERDSAAVREAEVRAIAAAQRDLQNIRAFYLAYEKIPDTDWKIDMLVLLRVAPTRTSGCFWQAYEIKVAGENP